jgi:hypothetical protein
MPCAENAERLAGPEGAADENVVVRMLKQHHDVSAIVSGRDRSPVRLCGAFAMFFLVACLAVGVGARLRFASDVLGMCGRFVVVGGPDGKELGGGSSGSSSSGSSGSTPSGLCVHERCCYGQFLGCTACVGPLPGCDGSYPDPSDDRSDVCIQSRCQAFMNDCMDSFTASMQLFAYHQMNNYEYVASCVMAPCAQLSLIFGAGRDSLVNSVLL